MLAAGVLRALIGLIFSSELLVGIGAALVLVSIIR